jgi:hypothetical protein
VDHIQRGGLGWPARSAGPFATPARCRRPVLTALSRWRLAAAMPLSSTNLRQPLADRPGQNEELMKLHLG